MMTGSPAVSRSGAPPDRRVGRRSDDQMKPHAAAARIDGSLAHLEARQVGRGRADLRRELGGERVGTVGLVQLELEQVVAVRIDEHGAPLVDRVVVAGGTRVASEAARDLVLHRGPRMTARLLELLGIGVGLQEIACQLVRKIVAVLAGDPEHRRQQAQVVRWVAQERHLQLRARMAQDAVEQRDRLVIGTAAQRRDARLDQT